MSSATKLAAMLLLTILVLLPCISFKGESRVIAPQSSRNNDSGGMPPPPPPPAATVFNKTKINVRHYRHSGGGVTPQGSVEFGCPEKNDCLLPSACSPDDFTCDDVDNIGKCTLYCDCRMGVCGCDCGRP